MVEANQVSITRIMNANVERVWAAWTQPELMERWWGPKDFTAPSIRMDVREGGTYLFCMRGKQRPDEPDLDFWDTGIYKEIMPLKKLVYTDSFADSEGNVVPRAAYGMGELPDEIVVTVEFEAIEDGKTKMTVTYTGAPAGQQAENMEAGWNQSIDKLTEVVR